MQFWINTIHEIDTNYSTICNLMKKIASGEKITVKSFGNDESFFLGCDGFYTYKNLYGESSYIQDCRETLTTDIINQTIKKIGDKDGITFVFGLINKYQGIMKYRNSSIKEFIREFLNKCWSYNGTFAQFAGGIECVNYKGTDILAKKIIMFPITRNDRGKSFTTASALLGLLRFPEFIFTENGNPRRIPTIINLLKNYYMEEAFGHEKFADEEDEESYYGWPQYNANYILWLKLAELGISTGYDSSQKIHGPMSYINSLKGISLQTTRLRQNYQNVTREVLSLGDKFLTQVNPKIVEFLEDRRKVLKL